MSPRRDMAAQGAGTAHEVAARWWVRALQAPLSAHEQARLQAWLEADPAHRHAYSAVRAAHGAFDRHGDATELQVLRREARAARPDAPARLPRLLALSTAAVLVAALGWSAWRHWLPTPVQIALDAAPVAAEMPESGSVTRIAAVPRSAVYHTGIGERAAIALPDGSIATLDTDSELRLDYGPRRRSLQLLRGQALFEVAKDPARPFQVAAAGQQVIALGTVFNVRKDGERVRVALIEGVVQVVSAATPATGADRRPRPPRRVVLAAGELLDAAPAMPTTVRTADTRRLARWRDGVVVFEDTRLADAVAEMNRYTTTPIAIGDPALAGYRVSGVFKTGDPVRFSVSLAEVFPVDVVRAADGTPVLRLRRD